MKVRFSSPALDELDAIYRYIVEHNGAAAKRVKARIREAAEQLGEFPEMARRTDRAGVRVRIVTPFPYLIFYTVRNDEVLILHIRHGARQPIAGTNE